MIPVGSLVWPLILKALKWLFDLLFGWAARKAREPSPPQAPPIEPAATGGNSTTPVQPVVVTEHDATSAALAGAAQQGIEEAHANKMADLASKDAAIDASNSAQLAESVNNVYQVPSTSNPKGS
jgi:hypothetical protein